LRIRANGLPTGLVAPSVEVAAAAADAVLKVFAPTNASPFSGAIQIIATETGSGREHSAMHSLASTGENNGVPQGFSRLLREQISQIWFNVLPSTNSVPRQKP
jgi:hypothetical protein